MVSIRRGAFVAIASSLAALAGCSSAPEDDSASSASAVQADCNAACAAPLHMDRNTCECVRDQGERGCRLFVDKVQVRQQLYDNDARNPALMTVDLFVKLDLARLGAVAHVRLHSHHKNASDGATWTTVEAKQLAPDYFKIPVMVWSYNRNAGTPQERDLATEGSIYVQTNAGERIWLNAVDGRDFVFDRGFVEKLPGDEAGQNGVKRSFMVNTESAELLGKTPKTADIAWNGSASYLNPRACR